LKKGNNPAISNLSLLLLEKVRMRRIYTALNAINNGLASFKDDVLSLTK